MNTFVHLFIQQRFLTYHAQDIVPGTGNMMISKAVTFLEGKMGTYQPLECQPLHNDRENTGV